MKSFLVGALAFTNAFGSREEHDHANLRMQAGRRSRSGRSEVFRVTRRTLQGVPLPTNGADHAVSVDLPEFRAQIRQVHFQHTAGLG